MNNATQNLDKRNAEQIYLQAVELAKIYCNEDWKNLFETNIDKEDFGIVLLTLFSKLTETIIRQINRIPQKHLLAFYDFIGIDYLPPLAAKAPLTFTLSEGSKEAVVPAKTKAASSQDSTIIFETAEQLSVLDFNIKSMYSLNPKEDKFTNHTDYITGSENGFSIFKGGSSEQHMEHKIYLYDKAFYSNVKQIDLILKAGKEYEQAIEKYFNKCFDSLDNPIKTELNVIVNRFINISIEPQQKKTDTQEEWIVFKTYLNPDIPNPEIESLEYSVVSMDIPPDAVICNQSLADIQKGFYPFGETPKKGDAFYIGSNEAFSKIGGTVNILFDVNAGIAAGDISLSWEYWNGVKWYAFKKTDIDDNTIKNFTKDGEFQVSLKCPTDIKSLELNNISSKWIRVRIVNEGYGSDGSYQIADYKDILQDMSPVQDKIFEVFGISADKCTPEIKKKVEDFFSNYRDKIKEKFAAKGAVTFGNSYVPPKYNPPFIKNVSINYTYTGSPSKCKVYNNFKFSDVNIQKEFAPFIFLTEDKFKLLPGKDGKCSENPIFYIGMSSDSINKLANKPLTLYFSFKTDLYDSSSQNNGKKADDNIKSLKWRYFSGTKWTDLSISDNTNLFSSNGIITLLVPSDISSHDFFGQGKNLYWISIELDAETGCKPPLLKGIYPNTVWAENLIRVTGELLGASNGKAFQTFSFSMKTVLEGQIIEVQEPNIPSKEEMDIIFEEEGESALRLEKNDAGDIQKIWIRWHEVRTFMHSSPLSRHYIIDRVNGKIIFGDGIYGMIPPALSNNIAAVEYKSGAGKKGNQKSEVITKLKASIPNIDSVANKDAASGARDIETSDEICKRIPYSLKNGGRAVTIEDFKQLAVEASPDVSKASCVKTADGDIQVIIAPAYENGNLYPESSLTDYVENYLKSRAFAGIKDSIKVMAPIYTSIDIAAIIVPVSLNVSAVESVNKKLINFLNPVTGGFDGTGWNFGEDIYLSDIAALIESDDNVDYVQSLQITKKAINEEPEIAKISDKTWVNINDNELPMPGVIIIEENSNADTNS